MKVLIPSALRSYTDPAETEASGTTLADVVADLDRLYPGIRFRMINEQGRIRPHIRFFVDGEQLHDLTLPLGAAREIIIAQALSGG
jgi:molybdopterin converting factor small subunit